MAMQHTESETGTRDLLRALSTAMRILGAERNETAAMRESFEHAARGFGAHEALLLRVASMDPVRLEKVHHIGKLTADQIEACIGLKSVPGVSPSLIRLTIASGEPQIIANSLDLEQDGSLSVSLSAAPHSVMASAVSDPWTHTVLAVLYFQTLATKRVYTPEDQGYLEAYTTALGQAFGLFLSSEKRYEELRRTAKAPAPDFIGDSPETTRLRIRLHEIFLPATCNPRPDPVLILGPTGSGKETVANYLHYYSSARSKGPFIAENCKTLAGPLCETKLFGHVRGAFTDAKTDAFGLFRQAHGGTLFLDEVGDLPPDGQALLLRVLDTRRVRPLGGQAEFDVNVQIILATNRDLQQAVGDGSFREDLYHRFKSLTIRLSPLAQRPGDLPPLLIHFFERHQRRLRKRTKGLTAQASEALMSYAWPGNVRELQAVTSALITNCTRDGGVIDVKLIQEICPEILSGPRAPVTVESVGASFREARQRWEHSFILDALRLHSWSIPQTAQAIGLNRTTLYRHLKEHGIAVGEDDATDSVSV